MEESNGVPTEVEFGVDRALFEDIAVERAQLASHGYRCRVVDMDALTDADSTVTGLILGPTRITRSHLEALGSLKVIGRPGVGLDNIDLAAAHDRGIGVLNAPDYCTEEVATHALALVLACVRRLRASDLQARDEWSRWHAIGEVRPLSGLTLGVVGLGRTGRLLAEWAAPLFARVVWTDPTVHDGPGDRASSLDELLAAADVVSLHVPLTEDTRNMLSRERLDTLRPGAAVVNVSRGGLVDEEALADKLADGSVAAAGLDVLLDEPDVGSARLFRMPNVLFTPHTAWYSTRSELAVRIDTVEAMVDYLSGRTPTTASLALDAR